MTVGVADDSNLILLLGLDPSREWTVAEVKAELDQKRRLWNMHSSQVGKLADEARRGREAMKKLKPDMILASSSKLAEHLREAREIRDKQRRQAETALLDEIQFASAKGYMLADELAALKERYAKRVPHEILEKHLDGIQVKSLESSETISELTLKLIDARLASVNENSLYSFLGLPNTASNDQLLRVADEKLNDARQRKQDDQKDLAGQAIVIFSDKAKRARYDQHAAESQFMHSVLEPYLPLCDLTKEITLTQAEYLLKRARNNATWEDGEAQQMLFSIALSRGWRVQVPAARSAAIDAAQQRLVDELKRELDEAREQKDALDRQRRKDVKELTDSEKRRIDAERKAREAREEQDRTKAELDKAKQRAKQRQQEIDDLMRRASEAEQLQKKLEADKFQDQQRLKAVSDEKLRFQVLLQEERERQSEELQKRFAELAPKLTTSIARRELLAAQAIIRSFLNMPMQWQADAQRVEADISKATGLLKQAKDIAATDPLLAERLLDSALALCADLEDALQLRRELPPVAPSELDVASDDQGATLSWSASPSRNVHYVVIRKEGSKPTSIHTGVRIAETSATQWRDDAPPPARTLWYAVYTEREGTVSTVGAHARESLFLRPEVADLRCDVEDGRVILLWRSPDRASAIIVVRREGTAPRGIDDGKRYELGIAEQFQDSDVQNGVRYFYRVYCEYLDAAYAPHHSEGKPIDAVPESPPQEVPALEVRGSQGRFSHDVSLIVEAPSRGELRIYRSDGAPDMPSSRRVPVRALDTVFGRTGFALREMRETLTRATNAFYTPVVTFHDTAYLGEPREYTYAPRLANVRAETDEQTIRVQWKWAIGCEGAEVSCTRRGVQTTTPRVEYVASAAGNAANPHIELPAMPRGDYDIAVRARYQLGNSAIFSDMEQVSVHVDGPIVIRYAVRVQHRTFGGKQYQLVLRASEPLSSAPSSIIVMRSDGRVPASPSDGMQVSVPATLHHEGTTWVIPLSSIALRPDSQIAVFPASPQQLGIRFEPESLDSQRIS